MHVVTIFRPRLNRGWNARAFCSRMAHSLLHETPANKTSPKDAECSMKMEGEKAWRMRIEWEKQSREQCLGGRAKGARLLVVLHFDRESTRLNLRRSSLGTGRSSIRCSGEAGDVAAVYERESVVNGKRWRARGKLRPPKRGTNSSWRAWPWSSRNRRPNETPEGLQSKQWPLIAQ